MSNIVKLYEGNQKLETAADALLEVIYERLDGEPIPTVLGVLELVKADVLQNAMEE